MDVLQKIDPNAKWKFLAHYLKSVRPDWTVSERDIAAELSYQDYLRSLHRPKRSSFYWRPGKGDIQKPLDIGK